MKFIGIEAGYIPSREEIEQLLDGAIKAWETRGYGRWSVFDQKTMEFIGFCGFRSEEGEPELIFALHEKFWGQGLAEEAANACLDYGFNKLGFTNVKAFTRPAHERARKVLDKLKAQFLNYVNFHGVEGAAYQLLPVEIKLYERSKKLAANVSLNTLR
jgi:ribosomal-protein-alanine N-acetyltransferase